MRRYMIAGLLAGLTLTGPASAQQAGAADYNAATVIATIDGTAITLGHLVAARDQFPAQYQDLPDPALFNIILEQMVDQVLLANSLSTDPAEDPLAIRLRMENERRQSLALRALNLRMKEAVDEARIEAEYASRFADVAGKSEYSAAHILVPTEAKAAELKSAIEGGADFAALARANSIDAASSARGGDLGWFEPGRMAPQFEAAVVAATPGAITEPVETQFGWHLIKVNATRDAVAPPLDAVRAQIAEELGRTALQGVLTEMRSGAEIDLSVTPVDPAAIRDDALLDD